MYVSIRMLENLNHLEIPLDIDKYFTIKAQIDSGVIWQNSTSPTKH